MINCISINKHATLRKYLKKFQKGCLTQLILHDVAAYVLCVITFGTATALMCSLLLTMNVLRAGS